MRKIVLIGDSIRMGYQPYVKSALSDSYSVWGPEQNGGTSVNVLNYLDEWVISRSPDVVHMNTGLHDIRRPIGLRQNTVNLDQYIANVKSIVTRILEGTDARLIWALTTPVDEEKHNATHRDMGDFQRHSDDVRSYNQAVSSMLEELNVEINDLYGVITKAGLETVMSLDGVHFNNHGYALLGKAVADVVGVN